MIVLIVPFRRFIVQGKNLIVGHRQENHRLDYRKRRNTLRVARVVSMGQIEVELWLKENVS